jgi:hypothetical protein
MDLVFPPSSRAVGHTWSGREALTALPVMFERGLSCMQTARLRRAEPSVLATCSGWEIEHSRRFGLKSLLSHDLPNTAN